MSSKDVIKQALLQNDICESDVAVLTTNKHHYLMHIFELIVLILCNFVLMNKMSSVEILNFMMSNFEEVLDIILIEIEQNVFYFDSIYEEEQKTDVIEFRNKDNCWLVVTMQDRVNKKLEKIM